MIPFADFTPDQPDFKNQGLVVKNVRPIANGYQQMEDLNEVTDALDGRAYGGISMRDSSANAHVFAADGTKIYKLSGSAWSNVSQAGNYTLDEGECWEFAAFYETVLACTPSENIQYYTPGTSTLFADRVADLQARHIAVVRDFVVVGNTYDSSDGQQPGRVRWSAIGDETDWTVDAATQSDFENLEAGGWIMRIIGGEFGLIFTENLLYRMSYIGPPVVFQFDAIEGAKGTVAGHSVIKVGHLVYYLAADGFYVTDGNSSQPIGAEKINRWFFENVRQESLGFVCAGYDAEKNCIYWTFEKAAEVAGNNNCILIYNLNVGKWSFADVEVEAFAFYRTTNTTAGLDDLLLETGDLMLQEDNSHIWLNDLATKYWTAGDERMAAFSPNHKMGFFDGDPLTATITTGEHQPIEGKRSRVIGLYPVVDGGTVTARVGSRAKQGDDVTWTASGSVRDSGRVSLRSNGKYHRVEVTIAGGFDDAVGCEVEWRPEGTR